MRENIDVVTVFVASLLIVNYIDKGKGGEVSYHFPLVIGTVDS
jgi:hypothetical protein